MSKAVKNRLWTFAEFCELIREDQEADLIKGAIYMVSPENTDANELFVWLLSLIHHHVQKHKLGRVFGSRVAFRLDDDNAPEPDVAFVRADRSHLIQRGFVQGPPDLAIEIVSPDSIDRDYRDKRDLYQQFGVTEYWIIDEMDQTVTVLRLNAQGRYRESRPRQGRHFSQVLPGFWINPDWLWEEPRPDLVETYNQINA